MNIAVIFAGGVGKRMGGAAGDVPKQFLSINGKPIIIHTLSIFDAHPCIDKIYVVCLKDYIDHMQKLINEFGIKKVAAVIPGGETAQDSTYNGLKKAVSENPADSIVLIHDGVRPILDEDVITDNINSAKKYGSAITTTPCNETLLISYDGVTPEQIPLRKNAFTAQAPQSFRLAEILAAHELIRRRPERYENMVDSATIYQALGKKTHMVKGNFGNIKITTPEDVYILRAYLRCHEDFQAFGMSEQNEK